MTRRDLTEKFKPGMPIWRCESCMPVVIKGQMEVVRVGLSRVRKDGTRKLGVYIRKPGSMFRGVWWPATRLSLRGE